MDLHPVDLGIVILYLVAVAALGVLYFTWYKNLPPPGEDAWDTELTHP